MAKTISMTEKEKKRLYELYQLDWMQNHGYSINDIFKICKDIAVDMAMDGNLDPDENIAQEEVKCIFENKVGFNGEMWVSYDEFLENEFKDEEYMEYLKSRDGYVFGKMPEELEELIKEAAGKLKEAQNARFDVIDYLQVNYGMTFEDQELNHDFEEECEWCYGIDKNTIKDFIEARTGGNEIG